MNIGQAIKDIRKQKGFSQKELAEKMEISQTSLSQIESGVKRPNPANMQKLCKVLDVAEPLIYIMATDINDIPQERRFLYEALFPTVRSMILQIAGT
jgi:transcriptional regulator with XRE-family HTH domain